MGLLIRINRTTLCFITAFLVCFGVIPAAGAQTGAGGRSIALTSIQREPPAYVNIQDVSGYRKDIITDELIDRCALPDAGAGQTPYWTGYVMENKIFRNGDEDGRWAKYTGGSRYFLEQEIKYLHDEGFNCARVVYSLSYLSNPDDVYSINTAELDQLDELISWGLKYDVHIMLSVTGLPGMYGASQEEENVGSNSAIFKDPDMEAAYTAYMEMLARRYAAVPTKALSFELLAEPAADWDARDPMKQYESVMTKVARAMWAYNADRILIASDLSKMLPSKLAAAGCCLSLHTHVYYVDAERFQNDTGLRIDTRWPMQVMPNTWEKNRKITLVSDNGFSGGKLSLYYAYYNKKPRIKADKETISTPDGNDTCVYDGGSFSVDVPEGAKKLEITFTDEFSLLAVRLTQPDYTLTLPATDVYDSRASEKKVTLRVGADGSAENIDSPQLTLNSDYVYDTFIKPFADCAKKNGTSFLMTEVGTDTQSLRPDEYTAYHETWLDALGSHGIGWMYNCYHNVCAPIDILWLNRGAGFSAFREVADIPNYMENAAVTDLLRKYQLTR